MKALTASALALLLAACSAERASEPASAPAGAVSTAAAPSAPARTVLLADPTPLQVEAIAAEWTGRDADADAMLRQDTAYLNATAAERPAVLERLAAERRAELDQARGVGRLEVSAPVGQATFERAEGVWHLPVFLPGSAIALAPRHRLRLSNAEGAYALAADSPLGQAMAGASAQPERVRLQVRLESVRPTEYGAEFTGRLEAFTLYDAEGRTVGETILMTAPRTPGS